jgi:hypothetical protein
MGPWWMTPSWWRAPSSPSSARRRSSSRGPNRVECAWVHATAKVTRPPN